jgi:hypothetical protein
MLALTFGPPFHSSMIFSPFGVMIPWGVIPSLAAGKVFLTVRVRVRSIVGLGLGVMSGSLSSRYPAFLSFIFIH